MRDPMRDNRWYQGWRNQLLIAAGALVLFTGIQFYGLHLLNGYFGSAAVKPAAAAQNRAEKKPKTKPKPKAPTIPLPAGVTLYAYAPDRTELAYFNSNQQLVVETAKKVLYKQTVGAVKKLQWLGDSGTLLFFVESTDLNAYLLQQEQSQPLLIGQFAGSNVSVANIYFSPYLEFMYIELDEGGAYDTIFKYDNVIGMKQLPIGNVKITNIQYDAKQDIMTITDSNGTVWTYKNDQLNRG